MAEVPPSNSKKPNRTLFALDSRRPTSDKFGVRTCVIFNPAARGEKAKHLRRHLDAIGASTTLRLTNAAGQGRDLAAQAVSAGFEVIVAAGGDGTLNEVLNGIGDVPDGFGRARLGVLPLGTVNVFAKELGLPIQVWRAWEVIQRGRERVIDLPQVEFAAGGAAPHPPSALPWTGRQRRYFAQMAGAGLDARAIDLVNWEVKKLIGPFAYVLAAGRALREPRPRITLSVGSETAVGELVLVGNGRYYGGRFQVFPKGDLGDGLLEGVVLPRATWFGLFRCGLALCARRLDRLKEVRCLRAGSFRLDSDPPARLEVDGEAVGNLPATFSVRPKTLRVIVP